MTDSNEKLAEMVFTIYPDPAVVDGMTFSSQFVVKPNYFPPSIQTLMDNITKADTPMEIETAVDALYSHVGTMKKEFIALFQQSKLRESINQRSLSVFVNEDNEPLIDQNGDLVYIAGPIGGGYPRLNHDLHEEKPEKQRYIVSFNNNIATPRNSTELIIAENEISDKFHLEDNDTLDEMVENPLVLNNTEFKLISSSQYFERKYHEVSSIIDFSPLLDSGMTAATALIKANLIYFQEFPEILKERLQQFKKDDLSNFDFLGIQKIVMATGKSLEIAGYRFVDNDREYNFVLEDLFKGLKVFMLSENSVFTLKNKIQELRSSSELLLEIESYESKYQSQGKFDSSFEGRLTGVLRELIGPKAMNQRLNHIDSKAVRVPVGFFQFRKGTKLRLETTFTATELPPEYYTIIESFGNALKFIENGPLRILKYYPSESSIYLTIEGNMFEICRQQPEQRVDEIMTIYYLAESEAGILKMFELRKIPIESWMEYFFEPSLRLDYHMVYARYEQYRTPKSTAMNQADTIRIVQSKKPVSLLAEKILSEFMVPVQLKRVLSEIENWEEGIHSEFDPENIPNYGDTVLLESSTWMDQKTSQNYIEGEKEKQIQQDLNRLGEEIDQFNQDLYSFLVRQLQRERHSDVDSTDKLYHTLKNVYQDMKVALIDFGLTPVEWIPAVDLQVWTTYQSQLNYMKHSLAMLLSDLLGFDYTGDDLELLSNYSKINHADYSSFDGMIQGDKYVLYKKAYKFFEEKLPTFRDEIEDITSLMELISKLEAAEEDARQRNRANLPKLPEIRH